MKCIIVYTKSFCILKSKWKLGAIQKIPLKLLIFIPIRFFIPSLLQVALTAQLKCHRLPVSYYFVSRHERIEESSTGCRIDSPILKLDNANHVVINYSFCVRHFNEPSCVQTPVVFGTVEIEDVFTIESHNKKLYVQKSCNAVCLIFLYMIYEILYFHA